MPLAVCFHASTRALLGVSPTTEDLLAQLGGSYPPQSITTVLPEWADVPPAPYAWDPALANFSLPRRTELLSQQQFMDRWELSGAGPCMDLLFALEAKDSAGGAYARKVLTRFRTARGIDPADPRTVQLTDALLGMGLTQSPPLLTSQQAADARAVILAPL
ncbi:MAG: hypothetical protein K2R93_12395 [Gemmatimonadaceae bacterium]|nr:hypothetical protein [Gemmatimonadaceae bacterium]